MRKKKIVSNNFLSLQPHNKPFCFGSRHSFCVLIYLFLHFACSLNSYSKFDICVISYCPYACADTHTHPKRDWHTNIFMSANLTCASAVSWSLYIYKKKESYIRKMTFFSLFWYCDIIILIFGEHISVHLIRKLLWRISCFKYTRANISCAPKFREKCQKKNSSSVLLIANG